MNQKLTRVFAPIVLAATTVLSGCAQIPCNPKPRATETSTPQRQLAQAGFDVVVTALPPVALGIAIAQKVSCTRDEQAARAAAIAAQYGPAANQ